MTIEIETKKGFSIGELVKFGWKTMKDNIGFFIGVLILATIIPNIFSGIASAVGPEHMVAVVILQIIAFILSIVVQIGLTKIALKFAKGEDPGFKDLVNGYRLILKYFIASVLYVLIILVGFVLLVFPGVIWGLRYSLFPYFIVERGAGPIEALKLSAKATYGAKWDLLGLFFVNALIIFLGLLCLIIGIFAAAPVTMVAGALAYRKLVEQTSGLV